MSLNTIHNITTACKIQKTNKIIIPIFMFDWNRRIYDDGIDDGSYNESKNVTNNKSGINKQTKTNRNSFTSYFLL